MQLFHLSGSIYFFVNIRGLDVHMEQKHYTQDKINVLSSVDCRHDYLQVQILWFVLMKCVVHTQCKGCTVKILINEMRVRDFFLQASKLFNLVPYPAIS